MFSSFAFAMLMDRQANQFLFKKVEFTHIKKFLKKNNNKKKIVHRTGLSESQYLRCVQLFHKSFEDLFF
jgi:PHP family Zn ribbon phosphoesterase